MHCGIYEMIWGCGPATKGYVDDNSQWHHWQQSWHYVDSWCFSLCRENCGENDHSVYDKFFFHTGYGFTLLITISLLKGSFNDILMSSIPNDY